MSPTRNSPLINLEQLRDANKKISRELVIICLYPVVFTIAVLILNKFFFPGLLNSDHFLNWDAGHYSWIKEYGYEGFRVAFFPLFPLIWKATALGIYGIVIFNALLYLISFFILIKTLKVSPAETALYLSIPASIFYFLPFSESIFFAASTILIAGMRNNKLHFILIGLLLSTLSRPAFAIFIPAVIIAELISGKINKQTIVRLTLQMAVILAGICMVGLIQYIYTGEWFKFFSVQADWGNKLQIPKLPLTSWAGGLIVRLDGAAMLFGTAAGIVLLLKIFRIGYFRTLQMPKEVIFSLAYLGGITLSVLLFRGGSLFSLNRFVFAVPFIIVAVNYFLKQELDMNLKKILIGFLLIFAFFLFFGSYVHILSLLNFMLLSVYLSLILALKYKNQLTARILFLVLIGLNIVFQVFFYVRFLEGGWIG